MVVKTEAGSKAEGKTVVSYHFIESQDYHQSHHYFARGQMLFSLGTFPLLLQRYPYKDCKNIEGVAFGKINLIKMKKKKKKS